MALKTLVSGVVVQAAAESELYFAQLRSIENITEEVTIDEQATVDDFDCEKFGTSDFDEAGFINHLEVLAKDTVPDLNFKFQQGACQVRYEPYEYTSGKRRRRRTRPRYHEEYPPAMEHQNLYCGNVASVCASSCAVAGGCIGFEVMLQRQLPEYSWCRIYAESADTVALWKSEERLPIGGAGPWLSVARARTKEREYPNRASTGIDTADATTTNFCMGLPQPTPPNPPTPEPTRPEPTFAPTPLPTREPPTPTFPPAPTPAPTVPPTPGPAPTLAPTEPPTRPDPTSPPTPCPSCPECPPDDTTTLAPTIAPTPAPTPWCDRPTTDAGFLLTGSASTSSLKKGTASGVVRYKDRTVTSKGVRTPADLLMIPKTVWKGKQCNKLNQCTTGGYDAIGGFGMINFEVGEENSEYEFDFKFVHPGQEAGSAAIEVDDVYIEFYDIDRGASKKAGNIVEKVVLDAREVSGKPSVGSKISLIDESQREGSWQWGLQAEEFADNANNPSSLTKIGPIQEKVKARVRYQNVGKFWTKFGVGWKGGKGGRNIYFSLHECPVE